MRFAFLSSSLTPASKRKSNNIHVKNSKRSSPPPPYEEVEKLKNELARHDELYHTNGSPIITDSEYDALKVRLLNLEASSTTPPFSSVGSTPPSSSTLRKITHSLPMRSLHSVNNVEDLMTWHSRLMSKLGGSIAEEDLAWVVEPKVDGLAISLLYQDGQLKQGATRGDGSIGEDITHNVLHGKIQGIPPSFDPRSIHALSYGPLPSLLEVRGEVFMSNDALARVNEKQVEEGLSPFANTRNAAVGSLRLLDSQQCASRQLSFFAYQLLAPTLPSSSASTPLPMKTHWECRSWLLGLGFSLTPDTKRTSPQQGGIKDALSLAQDFMQRRQGLSYDVDGAVLKLDSLDLQQKLGSNSTEPHWAVAFKFPSQEAVTKLLNIHLQVGRTGVLFPVADLEPVSINGVTIVHASLHNLGVVRSLDVRPGDQVMVQRAGDVIPQIMRPLIELRPKAVEEAGPWEPPSCCPCCGSNVSIESSATTATMSCENPSCSARSNRGLLHFASVCLKGSTIGPSVIQAMQDAGLVKDVSDLFAISLDQLRNLPGFAEKKAANVVEGINEAARTMSLGLLLSGLNIPLVGTRTSKDLAETFKTMQELQGAAEEELSRVPGVGAKIAQSVVTWLAEPSNKALIERLKSRGVSCLDSNPYRNQVLKLLESSETKHEANGTSSSSAADGPLIGLNGKTVVITGSLKLRPMTRDEFELLLQKSGATLGDRVGKSTSLLIQGEKPGMAKVRDATNKGIEVLSEVEFWRRHSG